MEKTLTSPLAVYPLIAQQILDDYRISDGKCADIGTGPGHLGIELAAITDLEMYFVDLNPDALQAAKKSAQERELLNTLHFVGADASALPFEDDFFDLVISRGSLWFWKDQAGGMREIHRVLKPGGIAMAGGGLGRYTPESMRKRLRGRGRKKLEEQGERGFLRGEALERLMQETGIPDYRLFSDTEGEPAHWVEIKK